MVEMDRSLILMQLWSRNLLHTVCEKLELRPVYLGYAKTPVKVKRHLENAILLLGYWNER